MDVFDHPAMLPESLPAFHTTTGNTSSDVALLQITPTTGTLIALVRMQFARTFAGWPFSPGTAGTASRVDSNVIESGRLAPVICPFPINLVVFTQPAGRSRNTTQTPLARGPPEVSRRARVRRRSVTSRLRKPCGADRRPPRADLAPYRSRSRKARRPAR